MSDDKRVDDALDLLLEDLQLEQRAKKKKTPESDEKLSLADMPRPPSAPPAEETTKESGGLTVKINSSDEPVQPSPPKRGRITTEPGVLRIATIGDSNTAGQFNYLRALEQLAPGKIKDVYNQGRACWQTKHIRYGANVSKWGGSKGCPNGPEILTGAINSDPDYLIIQAGANDVMSGVSYTKTIRNLEGIFSTIRDRDPDISIILFSVPGCIGRSAKSKDSEQIKENCQALQVWMTSKSWAKPGDLFINLDDLLSNKGTMLASYGSDIHWNHAGDRVIAQAVLASLRGNDHYSKAKLLFNQLPKNVPIEKLQLKQVTEFFQSQLGGLDKNTTYGRYHSLDPKKKKFEELDSAGQFLTALTAALTGIPLLMAAQRAGAVDISKLTIPQLTAIVRGDVTSEDTKISYGDIANQAYKQLVGGHGFDGPGEIGSFDMTQLPFKGVFLPRARSSYGIDKIPEEVQISAVEASKRYRIPKSLLFAILQFESGFKKGAISDKNARGIGQLMDYTINSPECRPIAAEMALDVSSKPAREQTVRNNKFNTLCSAAHLRTWYDSRKSKPSPGNITSSLELDMWYRAVIAYFSGRNGDRHVKKYLGKYDREERKTAGELSSKSMGVTGKIILYGNSIFNLWKEYNRSL